MDYEKLTKAPSFTFADTTNAPINSRFAKNAINVTPQFNRKHSNNAENYYYANNNNNGSINNLQFPNNSNGLNNTINNNNINLTTNSTSSTNNDLIANTTNHSNNHNFNNYPRQRFAPYYNKRSYANALMQQSNQQRYYNYFSQQQQSQLDIENGTNCQLVQSTDLNNNNNQNASINLNQNSFNNGNGLSASNTIIANTNGNNSFDLSDANTCVTLQISNLDTTIDERVLKQYLISKLKPITTVLSIYFEAISVAKIKLPSANHAKQVIAFLHRKKIGHKRITVSYTRESSSMEPSTLRCQVAGLLKDIPMYKLSMFKFRELFQSRFKTSISVIDLYEMKDICTIIENKNEDKYITLRSELINSIENSELMECLQHSVPYCTVHFVKTHRGWAEQEIDPLPNVHMNIAQIRSMIYTLLKNHKGDIPIASIIHCIQSELQIALERNESGVNFEHLITCVSGIQIASNKFGIKILSWLNANATSPETSNEETSMGRYSKYGNIPDSFSQVSREIVELIKLSPKSTLKFSRFIPAYHNHFGKQCRVADYGYTKLIDLFEALATVVQVMGEGENRQITLTHKVQVRRFTSDLLRVLRTQATKSILLSQLPMVFEQVQAKKFDITDYGVCDVKDILDCLVNSNIVVVTAIPHMMDTMISIPKRKQSALEIEKTSIFAGEVVELFKHASQYTILFEKFACSYHYHFGYQCRLCDYGFTKLADLMEAITGIVEMEFSNEEDRKIYLSPKAAQRVFSEQLKSLIESFSGASDTMINLHEVLVFHKKHYGYQIVPKSLGFDDMLSCVKSLPYIELITSNGYLYIKCHHDDQLFRQKCYAACRLLLETEQQVLPITDFIQIFADKFGDILNERIIESMKHAIEIQYVNDIKYVTITKMMRFVIHAISIIEPRGTIKVQDLRTILNISINGCFAFGYPNLSSLIQAFPDIFTLNISKPINSRAEITLNGQCLLTKEGMASFMQMQYPNDLNNNNVSKANNSNNNNLSNVSNNNLNIECNNTSIHGSSFTESVPVAATSSSSSLSSSSSSSSSTSSIANCMGPLEMNIHPIYNNISTYSNNKTNIDPDNHNIGLHSTTVESNDTSRMSLSHNSAGFDGNLMNCTSLAGDEKENSFYPSNQVNGLEDPSYYMFKNAVKTVSPENVVPRSFVGKEITFHGNKRHLNMNYNPPKPDTPPSNANSKNMPFWLDPIWGLEMNSPQSKTLNVNIPELKLFNITPKLNTPTVMASIAKKNKFSFENEEDLFLN